MHRLTVVLDGDDVACLQALEPQALGGGPESVLAFDLDVHLELRGRGIAHVTPWDVIGQDEFSQVAALQAEAWRFWQASARIIDSGVDVLALAEYRHAACLLRLTWAAYVIERALAKFRPRQVVTFDEPSGHGLDQPAGNGKMPLLFALLRGMAKQAGIDVRLLRRSDAKGPAGFVDQVAAQPQPDLPRVLMDEVVAGRPWILFHGSGGDLLRQKPIIDALRQDPRARDIAIVQLYKTADEQTLRQAEDSGHFLWHESQVTWETREIDDLSQAVAARSVFERARSVAPVALRGIFANPHLDIHFDFIFDEYARRMAWHARAWKALFTECRPLCVAVNHPAAIFDVAGHMDISAVMLPHALMVHGFSNWFRGFRGSRAAAIGRPHAERLGAAGFAVDRVRVTGDPALDPLLLKVKSFDHGAAKVAKAGLLERMGRSTSDRLILMPTTSISSPATMAMLPPVDWADAARQLEKLAGMMARRPQWAFVVKCHPRYDHPAMYAAMNQTLPATCQMLIASDEPLSELVPAADILVFPNAMSSALVEASLWPRPVIILDTSLAWWDHRAWETDHWPRVDSVDELERELERMFADPAAYAAAAARTQAAAGAFFGRRPEPGAQSCAAWLAEIAADEQATSRPRTGIAPLALGASG